MRPEDREQFEDEAEASRRVERLKKNFLDKFFEDKERQLFDTFRSCEIGDDDDLKAIHMMSKSLNSLQAEIQTVLNTGKMASLSLAQELDNDET